MIFRNSMYDSKMPEDIQKFFDGLSDLLIELEELRDSPNFKSFKAHEKKYILEMIDYLKGYLECTTQN